MLFLEKIFPYADKYNNYYYNGYRCLCRLCAGGASRGDGGVHEAGGADQAKDGTGGAQPAVGGVQERGQRQAGVAARHQQHRGQGAGEGRRLVATAEHRRVPELSRGRAAGHLQRRAHAHRRLLPRERARDRARQPRLLPEDEGRLLPLPRRVHHRRRAGANPTPNPKLTPSPSPNPDPNPYPYPKQEDVASKAEKAYELASNVAVHKLAPTHPIRLGLALNYSVFLFEVQVSLEP